MKVTLEELRYYIKAGCKTLKDIKKYKGE